MPAEPWPLEAPTAVLDRVIRSPEAAERAQTDLPGLLSELGVTGPDAQAMLRAGPQRLVVYRRLVHNRLRNTIRDFVPRTAARRGREAFRADVEAFVEARGAHSPYLRDVPAEFVAWAGPRWRDDEDIPNYLVDLARHELLSLDVRNDFRGGEPPTGQPMALDQPLRFDGATRLVRYDYAVHELPKPVEDTTEPEATSTHLLVYRDEHHKARYLALTELAYHIMQALLVDAMPVADGLRRACEAHGVPLDDERLAIAAQLLAELGERGVCLGAPNPAAT